MTDITNTLIAKPRSDAIDVTITTLEGTYNITNFHILCFTHNPCFSVGIYVIYVW